VVWPAAAPPEPLFALGLSSSHQAMSSGSTVSTWIRRHPIASYLLILYPLSWLFNLPGLLGKSGFGILSVDIPYQIGVLLSTIVGLTGVAFVVTRITDGKAGTRELRGHFYRFRVGPQWYLLALFGAAVLMLLIGVLLNGFSALSPFGKHSPEIFTTYLLNVVLIAVLISLGEEGGWMAFATTRLQRRWGPVLASVAVAPLFGFIHFPLLFISGGVTEGKLTPALFGLGILQLLFLNAVPVRLVLTWVYNSTSGSLPVVALLHASFDTLGSAAVLTVFYPGVDGEWLFAALAVVAIAAIVLTRGRLGYREEEKVPEGPA
jgi:membrane protease YdiL (CAAX protease family)